MATIVVQKGHCFRKSGATGTAREQEFTNACGDVLAGKLKGLGHTVHVVLADTPAPYPASDAFISLHTDGSTSQSRRGASVGYPDEAGAVLARAWKRAHSRLGFPGGFLKDNYTAALRSYYGYSRARAKRRFLAEHGTTTNPADREWLFANIDLCAQAHVDAIGEVLGHPTSPTPSPTPIPPSDNFAERVRNMPVLKQGATGHHVRIMQALLIVHARGMVGDANKFVDGNFGPGTAKVLRDWQALTKKLTPDGVCGPATWTWLVGV